MLANFFFRFLVILLQVFFLYTIFLFWMILEIFVFSTVIGEVLFFVFKDMIVFKDVGTQNCIFNRCILTAHRLLNLGCQCFGQPKNVDSHVDVHEFSRFLPILSSKTIIYLYCWRPQFYYSIQMPKVVLKSAEISGGLIALKLHVCVTQITIFIICYRSLKMLYCKSENFYYKLLH